MCAPSKVPSRIISLNQNEVFKTAPTKPKVKIKNPISKECIYNTKPKTKKKAEKETINGQGLGSTIWKLWAVIFFNFVFDTNVVFNIILEKV